MASAGAVLPRAVETGAAFSPSPDSISIFTSRDKKLPSLLILQEIVETSFGSVVGGGIGSLLALAGSSARGFSSFFLRGS